MTVKVDQETQYWERVLEGNRKCEVNQSLTLIVNLLIRLVSYFLAIYFPHA